MSLGWELALPIFGGVFLGHLLDQRSGEGYAYTLGLLLLGIAVGFYNVVRHAEPPSTCGGRTASGQQERPEER
jgi:F0F1-type ATP synthase assembly protein I